MNFNFGLATIVSNGTSLKLKVEIRDINNKVQIQEDLVVGKDLVFNQEKLRYSEMCLTLNERQRGIIQFNHMMSHLVDRKSLYFIFLGLLVIMTVNTLGPSLAVRMVPKLYISFKDLILWWNERNLDSSYSIVSNSPRS